MMKRYVMIGLCIGLSTVACSIERDETPLVHGTAHPAHYEKLLDYMEKAQTHYLSTAF